MNQTRNTFYSTCRKSFFWLQFKFSYRNVFSFPRFCLPHFLFSLWYWGSGQGHSAQFTSPNFAFIILKQYLPKLSKLGSNLWSLCFSFQSSWNYRSAAPHLASVSHFNHLFYVYHEINHREVLMGIKHHIFSKHQASWYILV